MKEIFVFAAFVAVATASQYVPSHQYLVLGYPAVLEFGYADTEYCMLRSNFGDTVFEDFGPCSYRIERVRPEHAGTWNVEIFRNHSSIYSKSFDVETVKRPQVMMSYVVNFEDEYVTLNCYVKTTLPISTAKFRSPEGEVLLVGEEEKFESYDDKELNEESNEEHNDHDKFLEKTRKGFRLKLKKRKNDVAGIWRCGLRLEGYDEVNDLFGFINLSKISDDNTPIYTIPSIRNRNRDVKVRSGNSFTLRCEIDASIDACHFRAFFTGKLYAVAPGVSNPEFEYVGAGFDAGECGIRIFNAAEEHMGPWTCDVDSTSHINSSPGHFNVIVEGIRVDFIFQSTGRLEIRANSNFDLSKTIEHCRFVRSNGDIFTSRGPTQPGYKVLMTLNWCALEINQATPIDRKNWLVGIKFRDEPREITSVVTPPGEEPLPPPPTPQPRPPSSGGSSFFWVWRTFFGFLILGFLLVLISLMITDYRRKWASRKSIAIRRDLGNNISHINTTNEAQNVPVVEPRLVDEKQAMA